MRTLCPVIALIFVTPLVLAARQDALEEAKRQYDAAGYEEALVTLSKAQDTSRPRVLQVEQYRALCFIALNRMPEAERAITALVSADPLYVPPPSVASPKVLGVMADVRAKALPSIARGLLDSGRTAFTDKNFEAARETFGLLLRLLDDPAMARSAERENLRVLASGFATLAAASANPAPSPAPATPEPASAPEPSSNGGGTGEAVKPSVVPAIPVREEFPTWTPDPLSARQEYSGTLQLHIGADGKVKAARIQEPSHPAYDARVVELSRAWVYKPATQDGQPVESERLITFKLRPPQ